MHTKFPKVGNVENVFVEETDSLRRQSSVNTMCPELEDLPLQTGGVFPGWGVGWERLHGREGLLLPKIEMKKWTQATARETA